MPSIVDPCFGAELRQLRTVAGVSLRQLASRALSSRGHLHDIEAGRRQPTVDLAERLDLALNSGDRLTSLIRVAPPSDELADHLAHLQEHPRRVEPAALAALADILAAHRRLEDSVGAAAVLPAVRVQLTFVTDLTIEARGGLRVRLMDVAAQWAQFGGWLNAAAGHPRVAGRWYSAALDWGTEAGNPDMIATVLSMRGHLAWQHRRPGPLIGLSAAALRQPASPGVRALAAQQEARGHALIGAASTAIGLLDQAVDLATQANEAPEREPPWIYFHSLDYLSMQRGLTYRLLGDNAQAVEHLRTGLHGLPPSAKGAVWTVPYRLDLAATLAELGDISDALEVYDRVRAIAETTGTGHVARRVDSAVRSLSAGSLRTHTTYP